MEVGVSEVEVDAGLYNDVSVKDSRGSLSRQAD